LEVCTVLTVRHVSLLVVLAGLLATAGLGDALAQTKGNTAPKAADSAPMTFQIYKSKNGDFRWRLMDGSGTEVGMSNKGYPMKADCQKTIDGIIAGAAKAKVEDQGK
jgi:uncharacterized protein YegP (UPF0339 family)